MKPLYAFTDDWIYGYAGQSMCDVRYGEQPQLFNNSDMQKALNSSGTGPMTLKMFSSSEKAGLFRIVVQGQRLQCGAMGGIEVVSVNNDGEAQICRIYRAGDNGCLYRCPCRGLCRFVWISVVQPAVRHITYIRN